MRGSASAAATPASASRAAMRTAGRGSDSSRVQSSAANGSLNRPRAPRMAALAPSSASRPSAAASSGAAARAPSASSARTARVRTRASGAERSSIERS